MLNLSCLPDESYKLINLHLRWSGKTVKNVMKFIIESKKSGVALSEAFESALRKLVSHLLWTAEKLSDLLINKDLDDGFVVWMSSIYVRNDFYHVAEIATDVHIPDTV